MANTALFIGVVSHVGSRFARSQGPQGLAARLQQALEQRGVPTTVVVNVDDLLDEQLQPLTPAMVQATLTAELRLDRQWARFLGRRLGPRWWLTYTARWGRRAWKALRPPSVSTLRRLLNIELSHLDLMERGIGSGAPWVLIIEDDADSLDVDDLADGLVGIMRASAPPVFANISASFTTAELGIDHLLHPADMRWAGEVDRSVLAAELPVTNTVCAVLYASPFLRELVAAMQALPPEPIVPIDWKLNAALMEMQRTGRIPANACWVVEPAPVPQMSMRPAGILPQ